MDDLSPLSVDEDLRLAVVQQALALNVLQRQGIIIIIITLFIYFYIL